MSSSEIVVFRSIEEILVLINDENNIHDRMRVNRLVLLGWANHLNSNLKLAVWLWHLTKYLGRYSTFKLLRTLFWRILRSVWGGQTLQDVREREALEAMLLSRHPDWLDCWKLPLPNRHTHIMDLKFWGLRDLSRYNYNLMRIPLDYQIRSLTKKISLIRSWTARRRYATLKAKSITNRTI